MLNYERQYMDLVNKIMEQGVDKNGRNGLTRSIFGEQLKVDLADGFPILNGRKIFYTGVLGELAAMLRKPQSKADFEAWGCNYWEKWCDADGAIRVDYGNSWFDFNGVDQVAELKEKLRHNPNDRRMLISSWNPGNVADLNLPCCHYAYQFYVDDDNGIHMIWIQRSVDTMIGLPSDVVFAAAWLVAIANEFGFTPRTITFQLGDTHIYGSHFPQVAQYRKQYVTSRNHGNVGFTYEAEPGADFCTFEPHNLLLLGYDPQPAIKMELL